jgi:hypothetical protein
VRILVMLTFLFLRKMTAGEEIFSDAAWLNRKNSSADWG